MASVLGDSSESPTGTSVNIDLSGSDSHNIVDIAVQSSAETSQINVSLTPDCINIAENSNRPQTAGATLVLQPLSNTPKRKYQEDDMDKQPLD